MITNEFDWGNFIDGQFQPSRWDSPVVAKQPGDESPGYFQDPPPGYRVDPWRLIGAPYLCF